MYEHTPATFDVLRRRTDNFIAAAVAFKIDPLVLSRLSAYSLPETGKAMWGKAVPSFLLPLRARPVSSLPRIVSTPFRLAPGYFTQLLSDDSSAILILNAHSEYKGLGECQKMLNLLGLLSKFAPSTLACTSSD